MNIKSLLLGSAAAMTAVSGASAADAIIAAEPEPVEYVRICDAFGSGYFFIPGTETCLRLSGYARFRVFSDDDADSYSSSIRGRLTLDAKEDTEMGELHARLRFQATSTSPVDSDPATGLDQGYLQLGGLFAGYTESAWVYSTNGGASGFGTFGIYDGAYGYRQNNMLQYQFNGDSWFAAISLEDNADSSTWTPDVVGRLGGVFSGVTIFGVAAYDESNAVGSEEFGLKLGLNSDIGANGSLIVQGYYATGATIYGANVSKAVGGTSTTFTPEWSILAGYRQDLNDDVRLWVNGQYFSDLYSGASGGNTGANAWSIGAGMDWSPVNNFTVTADVDYLDIDASSGIDSDDLEEWRFVVELRRDF